jgi:hypothetical protein
MTTTTTTTTTSTTSTTTTTLAAQSVVSGITTGLVNYWPVKSGVMADLIGSVNTTSSSPQFTTDRFGNANGAILVNSNESSWRLTNGVYLSGDFTITAWVMNIACSGFNMIG